MSYAQQYGDKPGQWFWENPPDALKGDEHFIRGTWQPCIQYQVGICSVATARRRLIQAGEGFRILGVDEGIGDGAEFTSDGIEWKTMWNEHKRTPAELDKKHDNILAIRVPIVVQAGHNNMMTPTEQVHAILEYKGWTVGHKTFTYDGDTKPYDWWNHTDGRTMGGDKLPNLLHSLDACHEVFEKDAPDSYWKLLCNINRDASLYNFIRAAKATCAQRVEAMVRAIGQWKDK